MGYLTRLFLKTWYLPHPAWLAVVLFPFTLIYGLVVEIRASLYRYGFLRVEKLPVPVVIVGNITVGGTGKTPFVIALAQALRQRGFHPGIISRGYGGHSGERDQPQRVTPASNPAEVGDEAIEIVSHTQAPMVVGRDRVAAGRHLLMHYPETNVVLSDDGLQHYRLDRTLEIAILDNVRRMGNGLPLPSGPLRERPSRLAHTCAIVMTTTNPNAEIQNSLRAFPRVPVFRQLLIPTVFHQVTRPECVRDKAAFVGDSPIHAVAGIGHPERFFDTLRQMGLDFTAHEFSDHHEFTPDDLNIPGARWILMTEKDAVKCRQFADDRCWFLGINSNIPTPLLNLIEEKLHEPY